MSSKIHIKTNYKQIVPTRDNVLVTEMEFGERKTKSGIIILGDNMEERGIRPRWCKVISVGPKNNDVKPGEWIYVSHGRWTRGLDLTDPKSGKSITVRLVDPKDILMASDKLPLDETVAPSHSY